MSNGKTIFLTGATGCLGSRVANDLAAQGYLVKALVRGTSDRRAIKPSANIIFVEGNLLEPASMISAAGGCDAAIHCAADLHYIPRTAAEFARSQTVNVNGTKQIMAVCAQVGIKHFIHLSSIAAMGDFYNIERDESFACTPESFYGQNKLDSEKIVNAYQGQGINVTIIRPGVIYGAWDRGTILKMIKYIHQGKFRFIGNGGNCKSIVSVGNVSAAVGAALLNPAAYGETFIVVDNEKLTMKQIASTIAAKLGVKLPRLNVPMSVGYVAGFLCDLIAKVAPVSLPLSLQNVKNFTHSATYSVKKIKEKLGFNPAEKFNTAIDNEIDWYLHTYLPANQQKPSAGSVGRQSPVQYFESTKLMEYSIQKKIKFDLFHHEFNADPHDVVLDIGAGSGIFAKRIAPAVQSVVCLDNSWPALQNTKRCLQDQPNIFYVVGDATAMPFKKNIFTKALAADVLEHIPNDAGVVEEIARCQKPGGTFIASAPCTDPALSLDWLRRLLGFHIEKSFGHVRAGYNLADCQKLLHGKFALIKVRYYFQFFGEIIRILLYIVRTARHGNRRWTQGEDTPEIEGSKTFRIYRWLYPLMLGFTRLDGLIKGLKGHQIMIVAKKNNL